MARDEAYQNAEQKIEEALRNAATELDLNGSKLTELPESLKQLTELRSLRLYNNQLEVLPDWLDQLKKLEILDLGFNGPVTPGIGNRLKELPPCISELRMLTTLDLSGNYFDELPQVIFGLFQLERFSARGNKLQSIPKEIADLKKLRYLNLNQNAITTIPPSLTKMEKLEELALGNTRLSPDSLSIIWRLKQLTGLYLQQSVLNPVPEEIGNLKRLINLSLWGCGLTELPKAIGELKNLKKIELYDNPLGPDLSAAYKEGVDAVKRYLRELAKGGKNRYEAKLLILGDGNEGKTCVSRALRGLPFRVQKTTRGVDVVQWRFPHPDDAANKGKEIALNIWDFEGQEISHQTHQFFLTSQALYVLVFKCRDQFLMDRAEYWLDTIRARAPQAKVVIVISQCEQRSPHIPLDKIQSQYGDMLAEEWFFSVGCKPEKGSKLGKNIEKLRNFLQRAASNLEFMGSPWPMSYEKAEAAIKAKSKTNVSHISRAKLDDILRKADVSEGNFDGAANSMARIGAITQFPDCPDLRDFVVLKPQWLTKAISIVMEDGQLSEDKGEIALKRMESIWSKARYVAMFATFHDCMKEFELCYDLEDHSSSCLVPLRFGYVAPSIPWTEIPGLKERRMEYKLNVRPPMGIMSRFIVKTHHMIVKTTKHPKGVYWHNGVFLRTNSPSASEALCEFLPDERIFRVRVRAAFPQNMCEQIHAYIQAVFSFFGGLSFERSYGCIKVDDRTGAESQCKGFHTEKRIYTEISMAEPALIGQPVLRCEHEQHQVDPRALVSGFSSFGGFIEQRLEDMMRRQLDKTPQWAEPFLHGVGTLLDWVQQNNGKLDQLLQGQATLAVEFKQEAELKLHEYLTCMSQMLDDRDHTAAPGLILLSTKDRSRWNPVSYFKNTYILTPYCECEGNIHACDDGAVPFTKDRAWWGKSAPWVARSVKLLAVGLQLGFVGMPLVSGSEVAKEIEDQVKFMEELTKHLELEAPKETKDSGSEQITGGEVGKDLRGSDRESKVTRAALARFLEETAPNKYRARQWGSLRRVRMSDNSYRWLCGDCAPKAR